MKIAAITVYYNEPNRINNWKKYYLDYKDDLFLHIIVDNGSDIDNFEILKLSFPDSIIIRREQNDGLTCAYNEGIKYALLNKYVDSIMHI